MYNFLSLDLVRHPGLDGGYTVGVRRLIDDISEKSSGLSDKQKIENLTK